MLFEPNNLAGISLRNRFVRSATYEGLVEDDSGFVTPELTAKMVELVKGGVGLVISGHTYVAQCGRASRLGIPTSRQLAVDDDKYIQGLSEMVSAVHDAGGKMLLQLAHAGAAGIDPATAVGPSEIYRKDDKHTCRAMTQSDINEVIQQFANAALRAKKAGFDGVQIHAAHGYLLSQFISSHYNKRTDCYGGSAENRGRIVVDILKAIRELVGNEYPVLVKINSEDFMDDGLTVDDMLVICSMLENAGISAIELSGGSLENPEDKTPVRKGDVKPEDEAYFKAAAKRLKNTVNVPVLLVGGIRSYSVAEDIVKNGIADYISLCRPLIRQPDLISRWKSGNHARAKCVSCNLCFRPILSGKGMYCLVDERLRRKQASQKM